MQWFKRGMVLGLAAVMILAISGCDLESQVLDTIGLSWGIVDVWLN